MSAHDPQGHPWYLDPVPPGRDASGRDTAGQLYPEALRKAERDLIGRTPRVGVGLSGGGIRSATLSLGFFQGLAGRKLLRHVDVLSTVSGGGYFGAFFGHLVRRTVRRPGDARAASGPGPADPVDARGVADDLLSDPNQRSIRFLRDNGRYLAPQGAGDLLSAAAVALRNWVSVLVVLALPLLALFSVVLLAQLELRPLIPEGWPAPVWWVSPFFVVAGLAIPVLAVPPGWAYWLVPDAGRRSGLIAQWLAPVAAVFLGVSRLSSPPATWSPTEWLILAVGGTAALTIGRFVISAVDLGRNGLGAETPQNQRNRLTRGLKRALTVIAVLLMLGVVDTVARVILLAWSVGIGVAYATLLASLGLLRAPLLGLVARLGGDPREGLRGRYLHALAAAIVLAAFLGVLAAVPHWMTWARGSVDEWAYWPTPRPGATTTLVVLAGVALVLAVAAGRIWSFVNRSSMHALYEARLRRAYLGASNEARDGEGDDRPPLTEPHPGDGMGWMEYSRRGSSAGADPAPLHLVNVTINETVDGRSQVQQRDRKGVGMAVGPAGVSVGRTHHALWRQDGPRRSPFARMATHVRGWFRPETPDAPGAKAGPAPAGFRVFPGRASPEMLDVGQWVAISGGAMSTGIGARTNLALSLLCGFFNVRLGYWWNSGVDPATRTHATRRSPVQRTLDHVRATMPVQFALADEWLARFPGTARPDWYLSDGGHFENLAGYELIRRRLPLIVICDNEQDQDYAFPGLANLVRKARTDLAAEIDFLQEDELRRVFGGRGNPDDEDEAWPHLLRPIESLRRGRHSRAEISAGPAAELVTEGRRDGLSLGHAAVARVTYLNYDADGVEKAPTFGMLIYVKPTLDGDEPADVREYHRTHPDFPHESTADQFFDEAQWESYRRLGEHMAERLFESVPYLAGIVEHVSGGEAHPLDLNRPFGDALEEAAREAGRIGEPR